MKNHLYPSPTLWGSDVATIPTCAMSRINVSITERGTNMRPVRSQHITRKRPAMNLIVLLWITSNSSVNLSSVLGNFRTKIVTQTVKLNAKNFGHFSVQMGWTQATKFDSKEFNSIYYSVIIHFYCALGTKHDSQIILRNILRSGYNILFIYHYLSETYCDLEYFFFIYSPIKYL